MTQPRLLFVYNADSGIVNTLKDYVHKIVKPSTYPCSLCAITFGNLGMKKEWETFISELDIPVEFLHRDEFKEQYDIPEAEFPSAYLKKDEKLTLVISREEMNATGSLEDMIQLVKDKNQGLN